MYQKLKPHFNRKNLVTVGIFAMFIYIGFATVGVIAKNYNLQQQIDELEQENQLLALQNQELEYQILYYQTDDFIDKEARDKLGLKAPGEKVVLFPDQVPQHIITETPEKAKAKAKKSFRQKSKDNFEQWMFFLFKNQT